MSYSLTKAFDVIKPFEEIEISAEIRAKEKGT
jgi:hypothetical protein